MGVLTMQRFTNIDGIAAPLSVANVDTDIIFPARFLLLTQRTGLGQYAFREWRYHADGSERAEFVLNQARYRNAPILVAGDNFGCGSSREQAPWALLDLGIRCIISTSFAEIFHANCFSNGILPVVVAASEWARLLEDAQHGLALHVDLVQQCVTRDSGESIAFTTEPWRREALLNGWDDIDRVLRNDAAAIAAFESRQRVAAPWLYEKD